MVSPNVSGGAPAGRTAYRDGYQCDHGPDLDEPFDQTESGHEFLVPVLLAEPSWGASGERVDGLRYRVTAHRFAPLTWPELAPAIC